MINNDISLKLLDGEYWWSGLVDEGFKMPFGQYTYKRNISDFGYNQSAPLLQSNKGRYIWSEEPYTFSFEDGYLNVSNAIGKIEYGEGYNNLRKVFLFTAKTYFPANGKYPDPLFFKVPQYNTWIEMMYEPTQEKVIAYADAIISNGLPAGMLIIDCNWAENYGVWDFHPGRFPEPKKMVDYLHKLGFKVMLWTCPFVSPDNVTFRYLEKQNFLIKNQKGETTIKHWWDGYSAVLDLTNEDAACWYCGQLNNLKEKYGIDGFKFDAGDPIYYSKDDVCKIPSQPWDHCGSYADIGLKYEFNEYRACWKHAGLPLVQRLADTSPRWDEWGLASLIPNGLAQGLAGYSYSCPDMIGGGQFSEFLEPDFTIDEELFVRNAQCVALFPMMQFSLAPWKALNPENLRYCVEAAKLHTKMGDYILKLAEHSSKTGEPIIRHMEYVFPGNGFERIKDQFMLGDDILVAPVLEKGAVKRAIKFPTGQWQGDDGSIVKGPVTETVNAPISRLPWYKRIT